MPDTYGYMVLIRNPASGRLTADWDGELHHDREDGAAALDEATAAGYDSVLAVLREEPTP